MKVNFLKMKNMVKDLIKLKMVYNLLDNLLMDLLVILKVKYIILMEINMKVKF